MAPLGRATPNGPARDAIFDTRRSLNRKHLRMETRQLPEATPHFLQLVPPPPLSQPPGATFSSRVSNSRFKVSIFGRFLMLPFRISLLISVNR